jgi:hypothetical protein
MTASGTSRGLLPKEREQVFEKVWKDVDEHYYDPEFGGVNWQGIHERYLRLRKMIRTFIPSWTA